ncbi:MAG: hypothetical protein WHS82_00535 [Candidatus Methanosuratincola sp.]
MSELSAEGRNKSKPGRQLRSAVALGMFVAAVFVALGTFFFSESLETLDVKAEELGFEGFNLLPAPFPEYAVPGLEDPFVTFLLGIASVVLVLAVSFAVGKLLGARQTSRGVPSA